ncbi:MAG: hypothetical protein PVJ67_01795 [Candidatus Pacearchaeota archaeon]|jgi:hypothetical protein
MEIEYEATFTNIDKDEIRKKLKEIGAEKLGLDYNDALFCSVDTLYNKKYGVPKEIINDKTPEILFGGGNPFDY